ncbi:FkbM family methyltransferase [Hyphomicrobium sp. CS1GBMeth3]|uniref:FkbM family methyltransferase n=1 Tax=Hyphomicrobium sp. CS1GBMeth3 TaxID=1892845 RepID=UPI0009308DE0|nr:FkbM family methyltransferase [Hyphomicrobium sp. CS1GBMeth3]
MNAFGFYALSRPEKLGILLARNTFAGRGSIRPLIEALFLPKRDTPRDCEIWGGQAKLRLPPKSSLKYILADERYNKAELEFLKLEIRPRDVFIDIGANIGFYTLWVGTLRSPDVRIISVEPNPSVYSALCENIDLNGLANVVTVQAAIGERDGETSFGVIPDGPGVGSILEKNGEQITVKMRTLANILSDHGAERCDILKIDVEGYEHHALMPYLTTTPTRNWPRALIIEQNGKSKSWPTDLIGFIVSSGYAVTLRTNGNVILSKNPEPHPTNERMMPGVYERPSRDAALNRTLLVPNQGEHDSKFPH